MIKGSPGTVRAGHRAAVILTKTLKHRKDEPNMEVDLIFKIAAIGITVTMLNQLLIRAGREEQAMMVALAGLIITLSMIVIEISNLFNTLRSVFDL